MNFIMCVTFRVERTFVVLCIQLCRQRAIDKYQSLIVSLTRLTGPFDQLVYIRQKISEKRPVDEVGL